MPVFDPEVFLNNPDVVFIGSRAWGFSTEESDWDYVVKRPLFNELQRVLVNAGIKMELSSSNNAYNEEESGFYVNWEGRKYNFIPAQDEDEFRCWLWAGDIMKDLPRSLFRLFRENKSRRVRFFRAMYSAFKTIWPPE